MRSYSILIVFCIRFTSLFIQYVIQNVSIYQKLNWTMGLNILLIFGSWCKHIFVHDFLHLIYIIMCTILRNVPTHQNVNTPMFSTHVSKILLIYGSWCHALLFLSSCVWFTISFIEYSRTKWLLKKQHC